MKRWWALLAGLVLVSMVAGCAGGGAAAGGGTLELMGAVAEARSFSAKQLRALGTQDSDYTNKDGETTTYTGVPFTAILAEAGMSADAAVLIFKASDGYEAQAMAAEVLACAGCIVAFQEQGGFRVVLPGFPSNIQVRDVTQIQVLSAAEALPQSPESAEGPIPNDGPVTVVDAAGRTVALERLPRRIVVVGRGPYMALHLLYTFPEGRERLVGVEAKSASMSDFIVRVDPDFLTNVASLAANPNAEQILALDPDLVLMKSVALEEMGEVLAQVDIPVVYLGLETPEQFFQDVANLGALLGNPERAAEVTAFYQSRVERVAQAVAGVPEGERPRVLLVDYADRGSEIAFQVPALGWMQTYQVQAAGGIPVWTGDIQVTDGWSVVNIEQIAAWDPDKIFVVMDWDEDAQAVIDSLKANVYWKELAAVKAGELYAFPMDAFGWNVPEPRWILGLTWLATRIHPELFPELDVREEVFTFFGELYGMDTTATSAAVMPRVKLDVR